MEHAENLKGLNIYVVEDHDMVRESLACLLEVYDAIVFQYETAEEFLDQIDGVAPGVVLADLRLPELDGIEMIERFSASRPDLKTIVLTAHGDVDAAVAALRAGAQDFIHKPYKEQDIVSAIGKQAEELKSLGSAVHAKVRAREKLSQLSAREFQVAEYLAQGLSNKRIAHELGLSVRTVEMHRARAMSRLNVKTLAELVALMVRGEVADSGQESA